MLLCRVLFFYLCSSFSRACVFAFDNIIFSVVDFAAGYWNMPLHICGVHTCDFYSYFSVFYRYSSSGDFHSFDLWWWFVRMTEMQCMFVEVIALVHICPVIIYWKQETLFMRKIIRNCKVGFCWQKNCLQFVSPQTKAAYKLSGTALYCIKRMNFSFDEQI